jgi:hypothetical protein
VAALMRSGGRSARRGWRLPALLLLACGLATGALAATVVVDASADPDSRIELRRIVLPDGTEAELYVLAGDPMVVVIDDEQRLEGRLIEFDPTAREVRIVGPGAITVGGEHFEGRDLVIGLRDERFSGRDVLIVTGEIDVWGDLATRLPGQVDVLGGTFSPCSHCDQDPWDYGFVAERLRLFPGDRLVAEGVTVLIRGRPVARLPLLVLPLAAPEHQPRLVITPGGRQRRATIELSWPYVAGIDGLGRITLRYLAEVDPTQGGFLAQRLLGGAVLASHFAWEVDHRLFDERGAGSVRIGYLPPLPDLAGDAIDPAELTVRVRYATDPILGPPSLRLGLDRADRRAPGRWEYDLGVLGEGDALRGRFDSRGFIDTAPGADVGLAPSYAGVGEPRRTITRLRLEPLEPARWGLGPVRLVAGELDLGAFEDVSDPMNRTAAITPFSVAGRARVVHVTQLEPLRPWAGLQIDARNAFDGRYFETGERLILWRTTAAVRQAFGNAGTLTLSADRDVNEGETPFRFDSVPRRNRTEFGVQLRLAPSARWSLDHVAGYVLLDTRRPEDEGWRPFDTTLRLFGDLPALGASVRHRLDPQEGGPHTLEASLELRARRAPAELTFTASHLQDLAAETVDGTRVSATRSAATLALGVERAFRLNVQTAYLPAPAPAADGRLSHWEPLAIRLELGAMQARDLRPGLRAELRYDLDELRAERLTLAARARLGEAELDASQRVDLQDGAVSDTRVGLTWPGRFSVVLRGVAWLPPALLGLEPAPAVRPVSLVLREEPEAGPVRWEVSLRASFDPALAAGAGGRRDTALDLRVELLRERYGPFDVSLAGFAEWRLRDDLLDRSHLRRATLTLGVDAFERVGLQGSVRYVGIYSPTLEDFTRAELQLDDVAVTLRVSDDLTFGARLSDVWDFTRTRPDQSPWNLRPEVFVVLDRCCWALVAGYDIGTGDLRLVLTGPGAQTGIEEILPTPFGLERRELEPRP